MPSFISLQQNQPKQPASQEPTTSAPSGATGNEPVLYEGLMPGDGEKLVALIAKKRESWQWKRRGIVLKVLKNKEMLKGNQFMGIYPGTFDTFDAFEEYYNFTGSNQQTEDRSMDRRPHNFYQMVEKAFISALGAEIPKVRFMPENADVEEDRETAKQGSKIQEIIERANKVQVMVNQELMELFTSGCYFKITNYIVDADRTGTHKETTLTMKKTDVLPPRFVCFECVTVTPEDDVAGQKSLACPSCGAPLGQQNFFESHVDEMPIAQQKSDVANGMVLWDIFGPLHADADPEAADLANTPLFNVSLEVSLGWLRQTFPKLWESGAFDYGQQSGTSGETLDRNYRAMVTAPAGYSAWMNYSANDKPTYSRTWCQPMLFAEMDDQATAQRFMKVFPKGCMLAHVADKPLQIRPAKLTDEVSWCGSEQKGFGLFPPPVGDPAVPVQERINDCISKIDEYFDRLACGILLANSKYIDTQALNNKPMLPGVLNPIAFKQNAPENIQNLIFQVKAEIDQMIFRYVEALKHDMELLVGTPPQVFGAGTQPGVETASGQEQQLNTGMMKLNIHWNSIRQEHAEAAENAVKCAGQNMTEDWFKVVTDETEEFRNEYVHLDQMKGSVHAEPEADQGFPMTYAEIKGWFEQLMQGPTEILDFLIQEPENLDTMLRYVGVPGLAAPGAAMRSKSLRIIDMLVNGAPMQQQDPMTGQPVMIPMGQDKRTGAVMQVMPQKYLDDLAAWQLIIPAWAKKHWDKLEGNQEAIDNLVAFYKMCIVMEKELALEKQMSAAPPMGGPGTPPMPPPQQAQQPQPAMA